MLLRAPLKANGHVTLDLCFPNGTIRRNVISKTVLKIVPSFYTALRKTCWGGLFPSLHILNSKNNLQMNDELLSSNKGNFIDKNKEKNDLGLKENNILENTIKVIKPRVNVQLDGSENESSKSRRGKLKRNMELKNSIEKFENDHENLEVNVIEKTEIKGSEEKSSGRRKPIVLNASMLSKLKSRKLQEENKVVEE